MKCSKCARTIPNDSVFCEFCGNRINEPDSTDHSEKTKYNDTYSGEPTDGKTVPDNTKACATLSKPKHVSKYKTAAVVSSVICAATLVTCAVVLISNMQKNKEVHTNSDVSTSVSSHIETISAVSDETSSEITVSETSSDSLSVDSGTDSNLRSSFETSDDGWKQAYMDKAWEIAPEQLEGYPYFCKYVLFDIDQNGIPEMYIEGSGGGGIAARGLYTYSNGEIITIYDKNDTDDSIFLLQLGYSLNGDKGIYVANANDPEFSQKYYLIDNKLVQQNDKINSDDIVALTSNDKITASDIGQLAEMLSIAPPKGYEWKNAYVQKIKNDYPYCKSFDSVNAPYELIYINDDDIPELLIYDFKDDMDYENNIHLFTYADGEVKVISEGSSNGVNGENAFYGYVERKNIFMTSDFSAGHNRDINIVKTDDNWISNSLYKLQSQFYIQADGYKTDYYIDSSKVSENEYNALLDEYPLSGPAYGLDNVIDICKKIYEL